MSLNRTQIEWVKNPDGTQGFTWNPITGCLNHINGMCKGGNFPCYAYKIANGRVKNLYLANKLVAPASAYEFINVADPSSGVADPFYPRFWPERMREMTTAIGLNRSVGIFCCDMSDLFGIGIPDKWIEEIMWVIRGTPRHRFYLLTKQPQNLAKWSPFPDNCYVGVTATNHEYFAKAVVEFSTIEAKVKFISVEPFLDWRPAPIDFLASKLKENGINWLIIGAQTKPNVYPKIEHVREIVEAADKAGISVFLKENLRPLIHSTPLRQLAGMYVKGFKLRQEMPE